MEIFSRFIYLLLIILISAAMTSGLELTASTGSNDGSSSTKVVYGATVEDYANEHIGLNPEDGTLSNAFSGSGSLPSSSIYKNDAKGNYVSVYRSVSGKSGTTKWSYDWNTYIPYSSTAGSGVGANLWLTASNAYSIYGGSYSSNREGDNAQANININSNSLTTSSLSNYNTYATAFTNAANAYQNAYSATGSSIVVGPVAKNKEGDQAWDTITINSGSLSGYSDSASSALRTATTSQKTNSASGSSITAGPVAKNSEGDQAWSTTILSGSISSYGGYASVGTKSAATTQNFKSASISSIQAGSVSKNSEGDQAWDTTILQSGSLSGYSDAAYTTSNTASSSQSINSASSTSIRAGSVAQNGEGDLSNANIQIANGVLSGYSVTTATTKTSSKTSPTASIISITGTGALYASASNREGDNSYFKLMVTKGKITNPKFHALSTTGSAETYASIPNAYGQVAEINTQVLDKALGYQDTYVWNSKKWNTILKKYGDYDRSVDGKKVERGEGDFAAKKTNNVPFQNVQVTSRATKSDATITTSGFSKTALILDPRRWEFVDQFHVKEIRDPVMNSLKEKGYAVTYFSDSAVSKDKVFMMDQYTISAIHTHADSSTLCLSKPFDGKLSGDVYASDLKKEYTNRNRMTILVGCNTFTSRGSGTLADAVNKAASRGGTTDYWGMGYGRDFIIKYFDSMAKGNTVSKANSDARGMDAFDGKYKSLYLQGDMNLRL